MSITELLASWSQAAAEKNSLQMIFQLVSNDQQKMLNHLSKLKSLRRTKNMATLSRENQHHKFDQLFVVSVLNSKNRNP